MLSDDPVRLFQRLENFEVSFFRILPIEFLGDALPADHSLSSFSFQSFSTHKDSAFKTSQRATPYIMHGA